MSNLDLVIHYLPYWFLGIVMIVLTYQSKHRDILRVNVKSVVKWALWLCVVAVIRYFLFTKLASPEQIMKSLEAVLWIPWQLTLSVWWEDAVHVLPLLLIDRMLPQEWKWKRRAVMIPLIIFMQISFGLGHVYQGNLAALGLSFYIPFTFRIAKEKGIGTTMLCHVLYDLSTLLLIQYVLRTLA